MFRNLKGWEMAEVLKVLSELMNGGAPAVVSPTWSQWLSSALAFLSAVVGGAVTGFFTVWSTRKQMARQDHARQVRRVVELGVEPVRATVESFRSQLQDFRLRGHVDDQARRIEVDWLAFHAAAYRVRIYLEENELVDRGVDPVMPVFRLIAKAFAEDLKRTGEVRDEDHTAVQPILDGLVSLLEAVDVSSSQGSADVKAVLSARVSDFVEFRKHLSDRSLGTIAALCSRFMRGDDESKPETT